MNGKKSSLTTSAGMRKLYVFSFRLGVGSVLSAASVVKKTPRRRCTPKFAFPNFIMSPVPGWTLVNSLAIIISRLWRFGIFSPKSGGFCVPTETVGTRLNNLHG